MKKFGFQITDVAALGGFVLYLVLSPELDDPYVAFAILLTTLGALALVSRSN
ncbi:MAG TPA: hypothetical protein VL381_04230 [Rhodocyclaceae bacterium]|jgi:hypothetical protein|nr:hypothetical protein [Rhodocyclaceae bacterium]